MSLDIRLDPQEGTEGNSARPSSPVRVYESSWPGLVTVVVRGGHGLRLVRDQVQALADALYEYLEETE